MALASILINGVDIQTTYGANVTSIEGDSPLALSGKDNKLTLGGNVIATSNDTLHTALENIAELIGWTNDKVKTTSVQIFRINASTALTTNSGLYMVEVESFRVTPIEPVQIQRACNFQITFNIIDVLNGAGFTTQSLALVASTTLYCSTYFEDANCQNGASQLKINLVSNGTPTSNNTCVYSMADQEDIIEGINATLSAATGLSITNNGWCGNPAIRFPLAAGLSLTYPSAYALPVYNTNNFTIAMRFKPIASIASTGSYKGLFCVTSGVMGITIAAGSVGTPNNTIRCQVGGGTVDLDASAAVSSAWNTIILTSTGTTLSAMLKTPNGITTGSTTSGVCGDVGANLAIGSTTANVNRSDCVFGEVAIWKMPLSTVAATAYCNAVVPLSKLGTYDLNRNLTFYLDFAGGSLKGKCNRMSGIRRLTTAWNWHLDCEKQTVIYPLVGSTTELLLNPQSSDLANCNGIYGFRFPSVSRYNRFVCGMGAGMTTGALYLSYLPRKRR
jgi:hypothetical protein